MISASGVAAAAACRRGTVPLREVATGSLQCARSICAGVDWRHLQRRRSFARGGDLLRLTASMSDGAQSTSAGSKAVNVVVKGTVQGVFFRKWTVRTAQQLGLNGWVRNCRDGSVEAVFSGPPSAVDTMVEQCGSGPSAARVWSLDVSKWDNEVPEGFEQRPTW